VEQGVTGTAASFGELFTQFASLTSHIIWVYDLYPEEQVVFASPSFERVWGRKAQDLYARHRLWMESIHPEDRPGIAARYDHWLSHSPDETYQLEFRIVRPDGDVRWIFDHGKRIRDATGRSVRVIGIAEDITRRKQTETNLRESEQSFRQLADSLPELVLTCTPDGRPDFFNRRWTQYTGLTEEELLNGRWADCMHPDDGQKVLEGWDRALAVGGAYSAENRIRASDGNYRWFKAHGLPIRDSSGHLVRWCVSNTDLHDEFQLRESLRAERDRFSTIATTAPGVLHSFRIDRDGNFSFPFVGPGIRNIYGLPVEALRNDANVIRELIHPDDRAALSESTKRSAETMTPWNMEFRVRNPERGEIWVETNVMPLREENGAIVWHGFLTDVSARKRAERLQFHSQKLEALGTLSGGIAHDFNNLLLSIRGNTQLAISDLPADHPVLVSLDEVERAASRATELVRQILSFSRQGETRREVVELRPVVGEALKLLRATLPAMVRIVPSFRPDVPPVAVDVTQIHQIIMNLATNAAHAIGDAAGQLDVTIDAATIQPEEIVTSPDLHAGRYARITVSDNGCGMSRATLERVFDPFFTTKPPGQGTGLGLSVVHGIVRAHAGAITAYSQVGKGTTFRIYLPAATAGIEQAESVPQAPAPGSGEHVMYIDDEESLVFLAQRVLERMGYRVSGFSDPVQALATFLQSPDEFDVVVTDLSMPGMSGFNLSRALLEKRPELPIVLTTGYVRPEDKETARTSGIRELILKPNTIEELGRSLDRLFREMRQKN
jgi:PAS domain S-box-containing protein